jgi:branched-chain amino acid transport system ATP-binding protein
MLETKELSSGYGKVQIVNNVNIDIKKGEIVALIGRNGVGKSTFVKTVIGLLPANSGKIIFRDGEDITRMSANKRARSGLAYVPQGHGIFPDLTVEENLTVGTLINSSRKKEADYARIYDYFPRLAERRKQVAGTMSGGEQAMLSIGRGLINLPEILLLDEPSEGVQPNIVEQMGDIVLKVSEDFHLTVLLVEQHMGLIQQCSERAYVMDKGTIVTELDKNGVNDDTVISQYLSV